MFNLQGSEIIFILLLALVVLGPEKLPGAIRRFTETYNEIRKMGTGFQTELKDALDEPMREMKETAGLLRDQADPKKMMRASEEEAHDAIEAERDAERRLRAQEIAASRTAAADASGAHDAAESEVADDDAADSADAAPAAMDAPSTDDLAVPPTLTLDEADDVTPVTRDTVPLGSAPPAPGAPSSNGHAAPAARLGADEMTPPRGTERVELPTSGAGFAPPAPTERVDDVEAPRARETT